MEKQCIKSPYFRNKDCCRQNFLLAQLLTFRAQQYTEENLYWHSKIQLPLWEESCCLTVETAGRTPSPKADSLILAGETAGHHQQIHLLTFRWGLAWGGELRKMKSF